MDGRACLAALLPLTPILLRGRMDRERAAGPGSAEPDAHAVPWPHLGPTPSAPPAEVLGDPVAGSYTAPPPGTASGGTGCGGPLAEQALSGLRSEHDQAAPSEPKASRFYAVWHVPRHPNLWGVVEADEPGAWARVAALLPGGAYEGSGARLRRAPEDTYDSAVRLDQQDARRHRRPWRPQYLHLQ